jgi:hypothetical protein
VDGNAETWEGEEIETDEQGPIYIEAIFERGFGNSGFEKS